MDKGVVVVVSVRSGEIRRERREHNTTKSNYPITIPKPLSGSTISTCGRLFVDWQEIERINDSGREGAWRKSEEDSVGSTTDNRSD